MIVSVSETLPILLGFVLGNIADRQQNKIKDLINNSLVRTFIYFIIGLLCKYQATFVLLLGIALMNFISDLLGNYSSALITPSQRY